MLVSASDPSAVIKLSERESRTTSEIWREGHVCQINSCILGTRPALGGESLQSYLHKTWVGVRGWGVQVQKEWYQWNCLWSPNSSTSKTWVQRKHFPRKNKCKPPDQLHQSDQDLTHKQSNMIIKSTGEPLNCAQCNGSECMSSTSQAVSLKTLSTLHQELKKQNNKSKVWWLKRERKGSLRKGFKNSDF